MARIPGLLTVSASALLCTGVATASPFERYLAGQDDPVRPSSQVEDPPADPCDLTSDIVLDMINNCGIALLDDELEAGETIEVIAEEYSGDISVEVYVGGNLEINGQLSCEDGVWSYNDGDITISFEYYSDGTDEFLLVTYENTNTGVIEQLSLDPECDGVMRKAVCGCVKQSTNGTQTKNCVAEDCNTVEPCFETPAGASHGFCKWH